jgi:hypothetical protein
MADSFIYNLNESTVIKSTDFTLFDVVDTNTGEYFTKKVSYNTLVQQLTSGVIGTLQSRIDTLQSTLNVANQEISKKLDKTGLLLSNNEKMTGPLSINASLSVFDVAHFIKSINLQKNKIINLGTPQNDFDGVNKKYVDDKFNALNIPNASNLILKAGDIMTGFLTLPSNTPTNQTHAATKKYVDDKVPINAFLPLSGGNVTGPLYIQAPTIDTNPATKAYVDSKLVTGNFVRLSGDTMTGNLSVLEPLLDNHAATKKYVDDKLSNIGNGVFVPLAGNVSMTGSLSVSTPTLPLHAVTKKYVDDRIPAANFLNISGGSMTGPLSVNSPNTNTEAATKGYVDSRFPTNAFLPLAGGTVTGPLYIQTPTQDFNPSTKAYADSKLGGGGAYVPLSGNATMTGYLSVSEPVSDSHVSTKKYVDDRIPLLTSYVPISGNVTITGPLSVQTPTLARQAATKAYVDSKVVASVPYVPLSGGTLTGFLSVNEPTQPKHVVTKKYVDDKNPVNKFLPLSGGTMTGTLVLSSYSEQYQFVDFTTQGPLTIDLGVTPALGKFSNTIFIDLGADITGFTILPINTYLTGIVYNLTLFIKQKGNTSKFYNVIWTMLTGENASNITNVSWASGIQGPTISRLENAVDIVTLTRLEDKWYGFSSGQTFI